jgi:outer membrane protein assembly factor BamB
VESKLVGNRLILLVCGVLFFLPNAGGDGAEQTGIDLPWPESGPAIIWRRSLGRGFSGFAAADGRAFTQVQTPAGQFLVCLRIETGEVLWRSWYGYPWDEEGTWPGPYASPTYEGGRVYFAGCYGRVGCAEAGSGRVRWLVDLKRDLGAETAGFGYACSPLVEGGKVFLVAGGEGAAVVALDARDGSVVWKSGDDPPSYCAPLPVTVSGRRQIVSLTETAALAHDPETGAELWRYRISDGYDPHASRPVYEEPYLFFALPFRRGARVLKLSYGDGRAAADAVWESKVLSSQVVSSVIVAGYLYGFDVHDLQADARGRTKGELKCIELATGEVRWSTREVAHSNVLACEGILILFDENGTLAAARASSLGYQELARAEILPGELCWTMPALSGRYLLLRSRESMACVYLGSGQKRPADAAAVPGSEGGPVSRWLERYRDDSFWAPSIATLAVWYLFCLLGVLAPAWGIGGVLARASDGRSAAFTALALLLGSAGVPAYSALLGRFVFTWPAALCASLFPVVLAAETARRRPERAAGIRARVAILLFAAVCCGYYVACRRVSLVVAPGFLVGFLPAFPCVLILARLVLDRAGWARICAISLVSFTIYFWSSVLFTLWKTAAP